MKQRAPAFILVCRTPADISEDAAASLPHLDL